MSKKLSLAALKRNAASGAILFEMIERYGETGDAIPERCRGIRTVAKVNSIAIVLHSEHGDSGLRLPAATLVEYTGDTLTLYAAGKREPNAEEQKCLDEAKRIADEYEQKYPYVSAYWTLKDYFSKCPCPWMSGNEKVRGKWYMNGVVYDDSIRGEAELVYRIYRKEI